MIDFAVLGAGDHHMAYAFIDCVKFSYPGNISDAYLRKLEEFQERCQPIIGDIGYVNGSIYHSWHGKFKDRRYKERWSILRKAKFDPDKDIKYNYQGLVTIVLNKNPAHDKRIIKMTNQIILYFKQRNEDSVDV